MNDSLCELPVDWRSRHFAFRGRDGEPPRGKRSDRSGNQPAHLQGLSINFVFRMADKIKNCRENTPFSTI
jgi:hypothetical protein